MSYGSHMSPLSGLATPNDEHRPRGRVDRPDLVNLQGASWFTCRCGALTKSPFHSCHLPPLPKNEFYCMCPRAQRRGTTCSNVVYVKENVEVCDFCEIYDDYASDSDD